jgi:hypothetical protein
LVLFTKLWGSGKSAALGLDKKKVKFSNVLIMSFKNHYRSEFLNTFACQADGRTDRLKSYIYRKLLYYLKLHVNFLLSTFPLYYLKYQLSKVCTILSIILSKVCTTLSPSAINIMHNLTAINRFNMFKSNQPICALFLIFVSLYVYNNRMHRISLNLIYCKN